MATDLEQLSVTLSAKVDDFKREMASAVQEFDKDAGQIQQRNLQLTQSMSRSMSETATSAKFLSGALKQLVSVYAFQQLISGAIEANTQLAQLARTADLARVSAEKLQQIQFAAKRLGGADPADVNKAAHDLSLTAYKEAREGEGELSKFLEANNMKLTDRNGKAKDFNQLLDMAATLLQRAGSDAQAIDIGRLFNLSEDMVRALQQGPAAFRRMQDEARSAGAVIDEQTIQKAKEFDARWNDAWSKFPTYAKAAAVEALAALNPLGTWLTDLFSKLPGMAKAAVQAGGSSTQSGEDAQSLLDQTIKLNDPNSPGGQKAIVEAQTRLVEARTREARQVLADRLKAMEGDTSRRGVTTGEQFGPNLPKLNDPKRGKESAEKDDELDREEKRIQKQINALNGQAAAIGKVGEAAGAAEARERLFTAAQEAGRTITPALRLEIEKLAEAYGKVKSAVQAAKLEQDVAFERSQVFRTPDEQQIASRTRGLAADDAERLAGSMREVQNLTEGKEMAGSFVKGLVSDLENGVKAGQALENQLKRVLEKLADKALDKLISGAFGGLGGLFGGGGGGGDVVTPGIGAPGAFGPGFASGGLVGRDGTPTWIPAAALRGARQFALGGGMPAILHAGEIVLNQAQQKSVAAGLASGPKGGPINLTHAPVINGTGLSKEEVFSVLQQNNRHFERQIGPIFANWQRRYG
jgi:hypothetical protein